MCIASGKENQDSVGCVRVGESRRRGLEVCGVKKRGEIWEVYLVEVVRVKENNGFARRESEY